MFNIIYFDVTKFPPRIIYTKKVTYYVLFCCFNLIVLFPLKASCGVTLTICII